MPFFAYVGLFLLLPTGVIVVGSFFTKSGSFTLANFADVDKPYIIKSFTNSLIISSVSAGIGAVVGAVLAYAVVTGNPNGVLRRLVTSAAGVLAQFAGVPLAIALIATLGSDGFVTQFLLARGL
ncbi:MAG TPA: ABC transporter permease, partial [Candidatus Angelobacter sp.]|nr:ABC transporter permease [Candidatus Angelobacter sp.]